MKNILYLLLLILSVWTMPAKVCAQVDPTLSGMVLYYTDKAKKQYNTQVAMMAVETEGHVWLKNEVDKTKDYQKQFDEYLSKFRGVLSYAAQTYGFYYEINRLCENMGKLTDQIGETPTNAIAVAIHDKRNDIYVNIVNKSVGILNTVRQVCLENKMTEKQRIELVFSIRPQLQQMNHDLATLTKLVRCTNMAQVWYGIEYGSLPHREGKAGVIEECLGIWKVNAQGVKPN